MQSRKKLYQYAVLYHPKPTKDAMGNDTTPPSEIVLPITAALAGSDQEMTIVAARGIPEKFLTHLDEIEIIILQFNP
jgi:hypothetical protein